MKISEFCIKRPVFAWVVNLVIIVLGVLTWTQLNIRDLPKMIVPIISVITTYQGASAQLVENTVTTPLENDLANVENIESMHSDSEDGLSEIDIHFKIGTNIETAMSAVRDKVSQARGQLPSDITAPLIEKDYHDTSELIAISFTDPNKSLLQIRDYVKNYILPQLQTIKGVAQTKIYGMGTPAIRVWLKPQALKTYQLSTNQLLQAIKNNNVATPSGLLRTSTYNYPMLTNGMLNNVSSLQHLIVRNQQGKLVTLNDVAKVVKGSDDDYWGFRENQKVGVAVAIRPTQNANPINLVNQVYQKIPSIKQHLPASMKARVDFDFTTAMRSAISEAWFTLALAIAIVMAIVAIFLGSWRATLIPLLAIPISLISAFIIMNLLGYSINEMTLLALILAVGLVVDDAIVVVENIERHLIVGEQPMLAARRGSREIVFVIIAMTLSLSAVYLPLGFIDDLTGIFFRQFAFVLAFTIMTSGFVALTLSPMLCSRLLSRQHSHYQYCLTAVLTKLAAYYRQGLEKLLAIKFYTIAGFVWCCLAGLIIYYQLPQELAPNDDINVVVASINAPANASYQYTDNIIERVEKQMMAIHNKISVITRHNHLTPNQAVTILFLKPKSQRQLSAMQIANQLQQQAKKIAGARISIFNIKPLHFGNNAGLQFKLISNMPYPQLANIANHFVTHLSQYHGLRNINNELQLNHQLYRVNINRLACGQLHVTVKTVADTMQALFGGSRVGYFIRQHERDPIIVEMSRQTPDKLQWLKALTVANQQGTQIPLANLLSLKPAVAPQNLQHFDRLPEASINANLAPGVSLGTAINYINQQAKKWLPENVQIRYTGEAHNFLNSAHHMLLIFTCALLFIYLVLSAQFESFLDPLIILLTVPAAMLGALLSLYLLGLSLNIYSEIGLVTLIGLIAKHGILITQFANQQVSHGVTPYQAILHAAEIRLRPILMTTSAMILGGLPLVLANGAGAASRHALGWTLLGGLLIGTLGALFITPVFYLLLKGKHQQA